GTAQQAPSGSAPEPDRDEPKRDEQAAVRREDTRSGAEGRTADQSRSAEGGRGRRRAERVADAAQPTLDSAVETDGANRSAERNGTREAGSGNDRPSVDPEIQARVQQEIKARVEQRGNRDEQRQNGDRQDHDGEARQRGGDGDKERSDDGRRERRQNNGSNNQQQFDEEHSGGRR